MKVLFNGGPLDGVERVYPSNERIIRVPMLLPLTDRPISDVTVEETVPMTWLVYEQVGNSLRYDYQEAD